MPLTPSPLVAAGLASFEILADGKLLNGLYRIAGARVTKGINSIASASFEVIDGDPATGNFLTADASLLLPGTAITVKAGYDDKNELLFTGVITKLGIVSQGAQGMKASVECRDKAFKTSEERKSTVFENKSTSDALTEIIGTYAGISADIKATTKQHAELVQCENFDWDFIVTQAEANGHIVLNDLNTISTVEPSTAGPDVLTLEYGINVFGFSLELDARTQHTSVKASAWDPKQQKMLEVTAAATPLVAPGSATAASLAAATGGGTYHMHTTAAVDQESLQSLADALLVKLTLAKVKGSVEIPGTALAKPGCTVSLSRLGKEFSGRAFVSEVTHTLGSDWKTQLTLGMQENWFAQTKPAVASVTAAASTLPPVTGLFTAVVQQVDEDPNKEFRVQVLVPAWGKMLWARLAHSYATLAAGQHLYPEVKDEVILGFFGGDQRAPVILGALHSSTRPPAYPPDKKNTKKGIVTAGKLTLEFDDDQKIITLKTPQGNKLVISDAAKGVKLTDEQENTITLEKSGITLESKSALTIKAAKDLVLESTGGSISLQAATSLNIKGQEVSVAGQTSLELTSKATAKLTATAPLTIKGLVVLIN